MASDPIPQPDSAPEPAFGAGNEPVVPTPLPTAAPDAPLTNLSTTTTDSGLAPNLAALVAMLFPPFTSVIFLFLEKRNAFVRFWAMQSLFLGAVAIAFGIVSAVISVVLAHIFFLLFWAWMLIARLVDLAFLILWIVMMVKAYGDKEWEAPVIGQMARQQLARAPRL